MIDFPSWSSSGFAQMQKLETNRGVFIDFGAAFDLMAKESMKIVSSLGGFVCEGGPVIAVSAVSPCERETARWVVIGAGKEPLAVVASSPDTCNGKNAWSVRVLTKSKFR